MVTGKLRSHSALLRAPGAKGHLMKATSIKFTVLLATVFGMSHATLADAAYILSFEEVGSNVIATGSGSINLSDLSFDTTIASNQLHIIPTNAVLLVGAAFEGPVDVYGSVSGPSSFGPGTGQFSINGSGDLVGFNGPAGLLDVPQGYISGNPLSSSTTFLFESFAFLGLTPGAYVYSWGTGAGADTFTVDIGPVGPAVPEPSTWAMMLIGFAGLSYAGYRKARAPSAA
jgi:PEP-CTERM motif